MKAIEQSQRLEDMPDFGMAALGMSQAFDINAAFQEAIQGVASDTELALEEKVRRMEVIVSEGTSETYRHFVGFLQMAAQMEIMCNHDHAFSESMQNSPTLSGFMDSHKVDVGHNHKDNGDTDIDPKTGKKTKAKKRYGWFMLDSK